MDSDAMGRKDPVAVRSATNLKRPLNEDYFCVKVSCFGSLTPTENTEQPRGFDSKVFLTKHVCPWFVHIQHFGVLQKGNDAKIISRVGEKNQEIKFNMSVVGGCFFYFG